LFYDFNNQKLGLAEDEAMVKTTERSRKNEIFYQQFNTNLLSSQNKLYLGKFKLDIDAALQNTELIHFGEVGVYELQMKLSTLTYDANLHLPSKEHSEYIIGFQGFNQKNTNINEREEILLPDAATNNYSAFTLLQFTFFEKLKLQTGVRYDKKNISTAAVGNPVDALSYRAPLDNFFGSFSGSIGATYNFSEKLLFRANYAAAYCTPNIAELTSNGEHELRYEIGDPNLVPENSYETDLSIHYHQDNFTFDIAGFYNAVNHFIFITPTGETTSTGIDIFRYKQENSSLAGGEAGVHFHPKSVKWLHFESTFSTVTGKQKNGDFLPFIPANKLNFELRGEKEKLLFLKDVFIMGNTGTSFSQNNAAPDESTTKGYTLVDLSFGGSISIKNQFILLGLSANNIFDKKYTDHLSTLKEVNLFEPGRNIVFNLKIPFGIKSDN
jgi:iron complex outermembrane receptor protein